MEHEAKQRRAWDIDKRLEALMGCPIRVGAEVVKPKRSNGELLRHGFDTKNFILPDGTALDGDQLIVEGVLRGFERRIGVVCVDLEQLALNGAAEGRIAFRGATAVIMQGPAMVQMSHPYFVERIPTNEKAYWNCLRSVDGLYDLDLE